MPSNWGFISLCLLCYIYILCDEKCCLPPHVLYINEHVCSRTHIHLWHIIYVQINKLTTAWMRVSALYSMLFAPSVNEFNLIFFGAALKQKVPTSDLYWPSHIVHNNVVIFDVGLTCSCGYGWHFTRTICIKTFPSLNQIEHTFSSNFILSIKIKLTKLRWLFEYLFFAEYVELNIEKKAIW